MIVLPRNNISHNNNILYKSIGPLIKDYRQWLGICQETLAESIGISVRELQNWEADRHCIRIENLHDLAEVTGIPIYVCVALNANLPIWYSLQKKRFAYSSIEAQYLCKDKEFFRYPEISGNRSFAKTEKISTDKHITMILKCHQEIYCTNKPLKREVVKAAIAILPDLNQIIFDSSGHYVGHTICLPLSCNVYQQIKKQDNFEQYLTSERLSDIIAIREGVFFYYSIFAASLNIDHQMLIDAVRFLAKIDQKEKYIVAIIETTKLLNNIGMVLSKDWRNGKIGDFPELYEIELDALVRPFGPLKWLIKEHISSGGDKQDGIKKTRMPDCNIAIRTCPNPKCTQQSKPGNSRIIANGTYRSKNGTAVQRFLCKKCGKSFSTHAYSVPSRTPILFNILR